jgi:hypothetical protein
LQLLFVETAAFSKRVAKLGLEAELRELQAELLSNPEAGATDGGTGGLRKIRMPDSTRQKGKRSGARVHYLHLAARSVLYLVFVYSKDEQATLSSGQKKALRGVAEVIKAEWSGRKRLV